MKNFLNVHDVDNVEQLAQEAIALKNHKFEFQHLGKQKTMVLLFLNSSLRTRISTQKAAQNLGMQTIVLNLGQDSWQMEYEDGAIMNGNTAEHIKEGAAVISEYADIIGIRAFPTLVDKQRDYSEYVLHKFLENVKVPVVNMESATVHPLQSLTDLMTIREHSNKPKPKVVLSWAPHIRALPQCVSNSFAEWMNRAEVEFVITHPKGYELDEKFSGKAKIIHNQEEAFENADFIYAKNWSAYTDYGKILDEHANWMITDEKMQITNEAKFMHCLPTRRNLEVADDVLDATYSLVIKEAANREFAAQAVLKRILENY
ncbi:MAG TPA: N-acetylornithine carbamoyltransferase [Chitinophagales bacterium]|nr:N-acetylornithine carbamoyltransferase [Chitinophagales bacterium]MBP6155260.1 N-acetylornithine carbamoyltransferase [Chitinophagales bacterium]HQV78997.1 N-acetylornithine carbamoyltransferase [Chitinophagales bacterium]HQW79961.1 N-acetylornithine carbamoyltransferase [Chitinophagales bacterium]HRB67913.1 N-acetylornithine carbamoyltransferase [Chitinophagales bacterium]